MYLREDETRSPAAQDSRPRVSAVGGYGLQRHDLSSYGHGSVKADIAAAKAAGFCARS